jgi:hypothetical protein
VLSSWPVAVVDEEGNVLARSEPITGNVTGEAVRWPAGGGLEPHTGHRIRLRFEIEGARLYAFGVAS